MRCNVQFCIDTKADGMNGGRPYYLRTETAEEATDWYASVSCVLTFAGVKVGRLGIYRTLTPTIKCSH